MKIQVWGEEECMECSKVIGRLRASGFSVDEFEISAELTHAPVELRREIMASVQLNDGALPVLVIKKKVYTPSEVFGMIDRGEI